MSNVSENPIVMTHEQLANIIEDTGTLVRPCEEFFQCSKCRETCYCSKDCQRAHWNEHKPMCKERQSVIASKKRFRQKGETYHDWPTLQGWYRKHQCYFHCSYYRHSTTFHVLEIYKGASQSLLKTRFAYFDLSHNDETPNDVTIVTLKNVIAVPRSMVPVSANTAVQCERSVTHGYMCIFLSDMKHNSMALAMHQAPNAHWKKPDDQWALNTLLKCNIAGNF
ncbi:hypothetical protein ARMSODRAFT_1047013 [Armillaria solidipes]|uniref:MYND-type domain-containing protein n=1 Tax=Armillaria solidipes TaxID=1076256 RepID=A0A2H3B763_9AGAR|nr:hypothetical protein ARMSODRAFT_1047013 [Armillaria solidipes]